MTLPPSRAFLTSLLNTLTTNLPTPSQAPLNETYGDLSNPLRNLPSRHRSLLTTLHVLFPPPMLLQALDLLDRGFVTRLFSQDSHPPLDQQLVERQGEVWPPQAHVHLPEGAGPLPHSPENLRGKEKVMYLVRSSQPTKGRFSTSTSTTSTYVVYLTSWNCSCAAFAFSAFPASGYQASWDLDQHPDSDELTCDSGYENERCEKEWQFGGLSLHGTEGRCDGGGVPVCKHLLACLLGERWEDVLGNYVKERVAGREEMAGFAAEC